MRALIILPLAAISLFGLNLDQAIERALSDSPRIHKAQSDLRYAKANERTAEAAFLPTLDAAYNWQHINNTTAFSFPTTYRYSLSAKYNLFNGFSDKHTLEAQALQSEIAALTREATRSDLRLEVINAYLAVLKAAKSVKTQEDTLASLTRRYEDTLARYEQGMVAKNELLLIDVERLKSEQALFTAKSSVMQARAALDNLLGGTLESGERVENFEPALKEATEFKTLLERALESRSELKALQTAAEALQEQRKALTGGYYPRVDLSGDYVIYDKARSSGDIELQPNDQFITRVDVTWNLYAGGATESQRRALLEQTNGQNADTAQMKLDITYQLRDAYEAYKIAKNAHALAERTRQSAQENHRIVSDLYSYGKSDTLTLLTAQSNLTDATNAYNNSGYDLYAAYTALERISGP